MIVRVYGFDWGMYAERVMPALARWLIHDDDTAVRQLYEHTRCAQQEYFVPDVMRRLSTWLRALIFVRELPRGPQALYTYQRLCSAEQFTALSDRHVHRHPPQLYQNVEALRTIWGALVEEYCLSHLYPCAEELQRAQEQSESDRGAGHMVHDELVSLLHSVGLSELARQVSERAAAIEKEAASAIQPEAEADADLALMQSSPDDEEEEMGIVLGRDPTQYHLRGWLATISVRAMALFELLACERRSMPFGYRAGDPFGAYAGYLTPAEVRQLAACLRTAQPPDQREAERDYRLFRQQQSGDARAQSFRLIDEVLPAHAALFMQVVRSAARHRLGLICRVG